MTFHRFLFSPSTLFSWLFCPCFSFHLCTFISLVLWFYGGRGRLTAPFLTSTLIFSGFHMHSLSRVQWSLARMYSSANGLLFFCFFFLLCSFSKSNGRLSCCLLVVHCATISQQTSYKGLLLVAFSGKTQIVQVAHCVMGFWLWQTSMTCCIKV